MVDQLTLSILSYNHFRFQIRRGAQCLHSLSKKPVKPIQPSRAVKILGGSHHERIPPLHGRVPYAHIAL